MHGTNLLTALERMEAQLGHAGYHLDTHELTCDYFNDLSVCVCIRILQLGYTERP